VKIIPNLEFKENVLEKTIKQDLFVSMGNIGFGTKYNNPVFKDKE
jgi:hypothetical protein